MRVYNNYNYRLCNVTTTIMTYDTTIVPSQAVGTESGRLRELVYSANWHRFSIVERNLIF